MIIAGQRPVNCLTFLSVINLIQFASRQTFTFTRLVYFSLSLSLTLFGPLALPIPVCCDQPTCIVLHLKYLYIFSNPIPNVCVHCVQLCMYVCVLSQISNMLPEWSDISAILCSFLRILPSTCIIRVHWFC